MIKYFPPRRTVALFRTRHRRASLRCVRTAAVVAVIVAAGGINAARADLLLDRPFAGTGSLAFASKAGFQYIADDFTASGAWSVARVTWTGIYDTSFPLNDGDPLDVLIEFRSDSPGAPVDPALSSQSLTATVTGSVPLSVVSVAYNFSVDLSAPVDLTAGQTYYLSIVESEPVPYTGQGMFWGVSTFGGDTWYRQDPSNPWLLTAGPVDEMNFALYSAQAVPEPSALFLSLTGLATLLALRKRLPQGAIEDRRARG